MLSDTIVTGFGSGAVTFNKRTNSGTRSIWVPQGDTPGNERRLEIGHEITASKRVSTLVKIALVRPHPVTSVIEEASVQVKIVHPASFTLGEIQDVVDRVQILLADSTGFVVQLFNQER